MDKSIKSSALNYGLYLGLALSLITVIIYATNLEIFVKWWFGIGLFVLIVVMGIMSSIKSKQILGGFISFKDAFGSYFLTVLVGTLVSTVVSYIIFNIVDTDAAKELNEQILIVTKQSMERFGAPQETINEALAEAQKTDNFSIGNRLKSFGISLVIYSIFGLIGSAIIKKNNPDQA
ncbi:MAG: DUF4199 domain-containing protein [Flavobacteriaceae bacterium]|nr:DUF4199 domain-containing protein [Flavobacteriaceae bacterium]